MPRTSTPIIVTATIAALAVIAVTLLIVSGSRDGGDPASTEPSGAASAVVTEQPAQRAGGAEVVRPDSHVLGDPADGRVTVVEFLDFECEACLAWYPVVEQLRQRYAGEVRFVARYFPMPGHANAVNAALAVEAAAQQGRFEEMYTIMFGTQSTWGESQESKAALFRQFAVELGLDMAAYDSAVSDPATLARIEQDVTDGVALGVAGTPTFLLNGEQIQPMGPEDFATAIDASLAEAAR